MVFARRRLLRTILVDIALVGVVGDDPNSAAAHLFNKAAGRVIEFDSLHTQFQSPPDARDQGSNNDPADKQASDLDAFGPFHDIDDGGVDEDQGHQAEAEGGASFPRRQAERVTAIVAEVISARTPVAYAPACASTPARKPR